jgi:hypothetical protein
MVTALPGSPVDGEVVDLVVDSAGTYGGPFLWRCKYRAATSGFYKWHVIGGAALFGDIGTALSSGLTTTFADVAASVGPQVQLPKPGVYEVGVGARVMNTSLGHYLDMSYAIGSTAPDVQDGISVSIHDAGSRAWVSLSRVRQKTIATAALLKVQARVTNAATGYNMQDRWISARPVRIG